MSSGDFVLLALQITVMLAGALVFVLILGVGRWLGPPSLRWLKRHVSWPGWEGRRE